MYVYKLAPQSAFHFGLRGVGLEETATYCPADTLFSALCITLLEWEPDGKRRLDAWTDQFPGVDGADWPPLRLSSAFPYAGAVRFYPKPMVPANLGEEIQAQAKRLKKIAYVSEGVLSAWLEHAPLNGELEVRNLLHGGRVWVTGQELSQLEPFRAKSGEIQMWKKQMLPRVTVDRAASRSAVYQAGVVRFKAGAGLFVLAEFLGPDPEAERRRLTTLFQVLGHSGLGGERSSGYGQFGLEGPEPFAGFGPMNQSRFLTLSPYHPTWPEVQAGVLGDGAAYQLLTRRGWVGSPEGMALRRRMVRLLGEGSVLQHTGQASYGDLSDVTPQDDKGNVALSHTVLRYGIAFPVPVSVPLKGKEAG